LGLQTPFYGAQAGGQVVDRFLLRALRGGHDSIKRFPAASQPAKPKHR